ncbi:MAG: vitamin B12 dependent-methionine synthase activation domain-containing protein [Candidatus Thorarchaeota archaeon]
MRLLENIEIRLDNEEIIRLLKSKKSMKRKPTQKMVDDINDLKEYARQLIKPRGVYDIFDSEDLQPQFLFNKSEKTVLAVCTIGKELEDRISNIIDEGELAKGVILDAIASHAAEETAEQLNQIILNEIKEQIKDKEVTSRFSPGYCQWVLEEGQRVIFNSLPAEFIDVTLSVSMMMKPIKSVSFAFNIGTEVDKDLGVRDCETCDLINCAYRRTK